jgi:SlyX protein
MATTDNDNTALAARIDELEARLAQQDQAVLELSDEVYRQQRSIARLEADLGRLSEYVKAAAAPQPPPGSKDELPPHY